MTIKDVVDKFDISCDILRNYERVGMIPPAARTPSGIRGFGEQFKLGIPLGKIARPQEIANTILFLASSHASHITLQDIVVDGGSTLGA